MKRIKFATQVILVCVTLATTHLAQAAQIVVGQVAPLSGPEASQGRAYGAGMQLFFNEVNKAGGVNGHTFTLVRKDDGGRPEATVSVTRQLLAENKPMVLAGYFGNRNISELVNAGLLEKDKIVLVGYRAAEIRTETPLLYNVRASLNDQINKFTEHLTAFGITRIGLFYEEGPGATALIAAAEEAVKKSNASIISKASYPAGSTSVPPAVDAFIKTEPQAIIMVSSGAATVRFIEQYRASGGVAQLFVHSGANLEQVSKELAEDRLAFVSTVMRGVAIARVTPSPYKMTSLITKELTNAVSRADKLEVPASDVMMEGYIAAKVIVEAVRRQGAHPTREGMVVALESIDNLDLGGYVVGFKHGLHRGSKFVELSVIGGTGKIIQ